MIEEIIRQIKNFCNQQGVEEPTIFTEFGSFTVGESGATLFSIIDLKQQNDTENWYMIDSSFITTLPDTWGIGERFILLPINKWKNEYQRVNIGGLSCDNSDYYNAEVNQAQVYLPVIDPDDTEPLYLGFFHTGAYQDSISGYGGIKHCLIPSPKQILIYRDELGNLVDIMVRPEQTSDEMLKILGY
jgi:arginine decarboxylase